MTYKKFVIFNKNDTLSVFWTWHND